MPEMGPHSKAAQMCIPAVEGHPGPLRGTLPSAGLAENTVPMGLCCIDLDEEGGWGYACMHHFLGPPSPFLTPQ